MRRTACHPPLLAVLAVATVLATACTTTSSSSRCVSGVCAISLTGEQTLQVDVGGWERDLRVAPIEAAAVTLSARGDLERVPAGETTTVGDLAVRVDSVSGRDVHLTVRPA